MYTVFREGTLLHLGHKSKRNKMSQRSLHRLTLSLRILSSSWVSLWTTLYQFFLLYYGSVDRLMMHVLLGHETSFICTSFVWGDNGNCNVLVLSSFVRRIGQKNSNSFCLFWTTKYLFNGTTSVSHNRHNNVWMFHTLSILNTKTKKNKIKGIKYSFLLVLSSWNSSTLCQSTQQLYGGLRMYSYLYIQSRRVRPVTLPFS